MTGTPADPVAAAELDQDALEQARHAITGIYELRWGYPGEPTRGNLDARAVAAVAIGTYLAASGGSGEALSASPGSGRGDGHPCAELCQHPGECRAPAGGPCLRTRTLEGFFCPWSGDAMSGLCEPTSRILLRMMARACRRGGSGRELDTYARAYLSEERAERKKKAPPGGDKR